MRKYQSGTRWCVWRWTQVVIGGVEYLRRLHLVQTPWFSVMLHWIRRPDPQLDMHDHPVGFASFMVRGWYREQVPCDCGVDARGVHTKTHWEFSFKRATDRHRIVAVSPGGCLTLVFAGPVVRPWGFWTEEGWIPWREYQK